MSFALGRIALGISDREERSRCKSRSSRKSAIDIMLQKRDHTVEISLEAYEESYLGVDLRERKRETHDYDRLGKPGAYGGEHTHCSMYMHSAD